MRLLKICPGQLIPSTWITWSDTVSRSPKPLFTAFASFSGILANIPICFILNSSNSLEIQRHNFLLNNKSFHSKFAPEKKYVEAKWCRISSVCLAKVSISPFLNILCVRGFLEKNMFEELKMVRGNDCVKVARQFIFNYSQLDV